MVVSNIVTSSPSDIENLCNLYYSNAALFFSKLNAGEITQDDCYFINFETTATASFDRRKMSVYGMTLVISFKAGIAQHSEFSTTQGLKDYVENLLINVVEDGSFDDHLISLAKDEGLSIDTIIMLEDVKTERVEYTPVLVSVEESTKNESSKNDTPLQVGVAIGSFFFFVLVLSLFYYFFVVSKVRRGENVVNNHVVVSCDLM